MAVTVTVIAVAAEVLEELSAYTGVNRFLEEG
jgi:hypothetical protein